MAPAPAEVASRPGVARLPAGAIALARARADRRNVSLPSVAGLLRAPTRTPEGMRQDCARWVSTTASLRGLDDPFEVTRRIVDAVCGQQADSSLEEAEERYVAASVADWVLEQSEDGELPDVDDVARYAIATIVTEVLSSELGEALRDRPDEVADVAEDELRDAAMVLARQTELSASGPTEDELTRAIEEGLEKLRSIYGGGS